MFDTFGWTVDAYERVAVNDPSGPLADAAKMALGNVHFRDNNFEAAAEDYDSLIKSYPNSKYQMTAHVYNLQAKMRDLPGRRLRRRATEAGQEDRPAVAVAIRPQAGQGAGADPPGLCPHRGRAGQPGVPGRQVLRAAELLRRRPLLLQVRDGDYPASQKAKEAKAQIEKIGTLPDEPPNHFKWLTDLLQSDKR